MNRRHFVSKHFSGVTCCKYFCRKKWKENGQFRLKDLCNCKKLSQHWFPTKSPFFPGNLAKIVHDESTLGRANLIPSFFFSWASSIRGRRPQQFNKLGLKGLFLLRGFGIFAFLDTDAAKRVGAHSPKSRWPQLEAAAWTCKKLKMFLRKENIWFQSPAELQSRVARWFIFKPKITIWVNFEGP
jgi:hypothetical protein